MSLATAMWVHGHAVRIEHPDRFDTIWRAGFFVRLTGRPGVSTWIHYALPTPVIVRDQRLRVGRCMLRCRVPGGGAAIGAAHIYDGETRIAAHDGLRASPDSWAFLAWDVVSRPLVRWGVGLSVNLRFAAGVAAEGSHHVEISSAGCDFVS
jgi:hypothetical protein